MNLDDLRNANFKLLDDAVTDWSKMVSNLGELEKSATKGLLNAAQKADWQGLNATVSRQFVGKTAGEFGDAHKQAESIRNILRDTRDELKDYKRQLTEAIDRAWEQKVTVYGVAGGGFEAMISVHPEPKDAKQRIDTAVEEIKGILTRATESDSSAAKVLQAIADQSDLGFSDASYKDRDTAADAIKKADELAKLAAKDPDELTKTELNSINAGLAKYRNDPLFAEEFATKLGPQGTLEFYSGAAAAGAGTYDPDRLKTMKQLQKNLGITLGTATRSDSAAMDKWESTITSMGEKRLGEYEDGPRSFVVMSNLMRFGDYDTDFLTSYGDRLLEFDKQVDTDSHHGTPFWVNNHDQSNLNFWDKNDRGRDPVSGFLQALGHNPEASAQFFASPGVDGDYVDKESEVNENLKYLTKERHWYEDPTFEGDRDVMAGRDALGHALEAATTGYAYDADPMSAKDPMIPGSGDRRTEATADVMEQVAYLYGSEDGPKMLHDQPEMADSLGKMGAAYIDDIDHSISGFGDQSKDAGDFPSQYPGRANFGEQGAIDFLSVLGQNETSHNTVTAAQHLYTLSLLDAHPPTDADQIDHARDALNVGAQARGILDNAYVEQATADAEGDADEANKSIAKGDDWKKVAAGAVIAGGIAAIPLPGSTAAAIVFAPVAADTAGEILGTFLDHSIDDGAAEEDPTAKAQMTSAEFYGKGAGDLGTAYSSYLKDHPEVARTADHEDWKQRVEDAYYGTGSHKNEYRGRAPYED
ncbi:hypothetical protein H9Y04_04210 [Streptomyces sp. TRM66268-LWL]|uniref:AG2 protein n=1 Tax=Streptomyces polyasparticus TaxID=2767826 RepID=A0ABR7S8I3_9ACTN|nr:DUF6571 family protein [Streptomyces polyasparticus]MBC9711772.1 hypothetical protein [Streptomyces polyasparticus]